MAAEKATGRTVLSVTGADRTGFLQGLVTNDVERASDGLLYAALLTPQGKYLADFFLHETGEEVRIDVSTSLANGLMQRLNMYKLRADVRVDATELEVVRGLGDAPDGAFPDPRHPDLGWRGIGLVGGEGTTDWDALRVTYLIPESGIELIPNESYALECGFERLGAVDFKKGCYVGQEVTARMKHKTELRKGLAKVNVVGTAPVGTPITSNGRAVGTLFTQSGGQGIAYLRFDRAHGPLEAGGATVIYHAAD